VRLKLLNLGRWVRFACCWKRPLWRGEDRFVLRSYSPVETLRWMGH
jgi:hypothetical protein